MAAYTFRHLTAAQVTAIGAAATAAPTPPAITAEITAAWEADLAAHMALATAATDPAVRRTHNQAIATLEAALAANPV